MEPFPTLAAPAEAEIRVRSSRFIGYAFPVAAEDEAKAVLKERERLHFDARHHCAAWRLRSGIWRTLDAGEPAGSAGAPILARIDALGLLDAAIVVTRYFGGTKLGIGGLARAYADAASAALARSDIVTAIPAIRLEIGYPFSLSSVVMRALDRHGARDVEHGEILRNGQPVIRASIPNRSKDDLIRGLRDSSAGAVTVEEIGNTRFMETRPK